MDCATVLVKISDSERNIMELKKCYFLNKVIFQGVGGWHWLYICVKKLPVIWPIKDRDTLGKPHKRGYFII